MTETEHPHGPFSAVDLSDRVVRGLVDAAPDALVMATGDGRIVLVNSQLESIFGYEREELLGRPVEDLIPDRLRTSHRAHRTRYGAEPTVRAMGIGLELTGRRKDGSEIPVEVSLSPVTADEQSFVVAAIRDITERVAIEAEVRRIRELLDATRDGIFIFDVETLRCSYVNQGAIDQVGYTRDELLSMTPLHLLPRFTETELRDRLAPLLAGDVASTMYSTLHRRKDGVDLDVEVLVQAPEGESGGRSVFVAIVRDISERVATEERLHRADRELRLLEDRERIARDLHDNVIQRLFASGMMLQATESLVESEDVRRRVEEVVDELDHSIRDIRTAIYGLQGTHSNQQVGVRHAILEVISETRPGLKREPHVTFDGVIDVIDDETADHLLATLREALTNVAKHADATDVSVVVDATDDLVLTVTDDGAGIACDPSGPGNGLRNMERRAEQLGGSCRVSAGTSGGTVIEWRVPKRIGDART